MALLAGGPALGQYELAGLSQTQANLTNPGAKSLALGGAFVALADDGTAAFVNPAGIADTTAWQAGVAVKSFRFQPDLTPGLFEGAAGQFAALPTSSVTVSSRVTDVDFASVSGPLIPNRLAVAVYRSINFRYRFTLDEDLLLFDFRIAGTNPVSRVSTSEAGTVDLTNELYGLSLGTKLDLDSLSLGTLGLGAGITVSKLSLDLSGPGPGYRVTFRSFGGGPPATATVVSDVDDRWKAGLTLGMVWRLLEVPRVSIGASYRRNPSHDVAYTARSGGLEFRCTDGRPDAFGYIGCGSIKTPDDASFGLVLGLRHLFVAAEVQRVLYSQLGDGWTHLFRYNDFAGRFAVPRAEYSDATVLRAGVEYGIEMGRSTLYLRVGAFRESAHGARIRLKKDDALPPGVPDDGSDAQFQGFQVDQALAGVYNGGSAQNHVTGGLGVSVGRGLSLDVAIDHSRQLQSLSASLFYRF